MVKEAITVRIDEWMEEDITEITSTIALSPGEVVHEILEYVLGSTDLTREIFPGVIGQAAPPGEGQGGGAGDDEGEPAGKGDVSEGEDGDGCSGRCKGKGVQIDVFDGDCPEPCDQSKLDEMEEEAKKVARRDANRLCMDRGGPNCLCAGGRYYTKSKYCRTYTSSKKDGSKYCKYYVQVRYIGGNCTEIP